MRSTRQLSITLPLEMAQSIRAKVERGDYASESEVVREGLRALFEREAAVERWLREEVATAYDRHMANPDAARPLTAVVERFRLQRQDNSRAEK